MPRVIVHLDADAFFASVEQAADSRLRGKPVAVGGEKRGIIASASYEARKFGVYTPMPTSRARKLCPKLVILPGDFDKYEHFSRWMFSYAQDFTPDVEIASIDEGYFDLSGVRKPALDVAQTIRAAIGQSLKISVSEGIASNKLVSQIASKLNKPAAFQTVPTGTEVAFLHPLPNRWLPGVGPQTSQRLDAAGLAFIRHISATPADLLHLLVGRMAPVLKAHADGIDERPVVPMSAPAKSYSQQQTFDADLTDEDYAEAVLRRMADDLMAKVRADNKSIRTLTVKVRYNDMAEDQCGESLSEPTDLETDLYGRIHELFRQAWKRRVSLRLVSLKLSNVYDGIGRTELALEARGQRHDAQRRLAVVVDELRRTHGREAILRGHDFRLREPPLDTAALLSIKAPSVSNGVRVAMPRKVTSYIPLNIHSNFSFLDSTLSITAIIDLARKHKLPAVALTDTGNLHGAVEFCLAAKQAGIKPIVGAEIDVDGQPVLIYVENSTGYANLCHLLSHAQAGAGKEQSDEDTCQRRVALRSRQLDGHTDGLLAVSRHTALASWFKGRLYLAVSAADKREQGHDALPGVLVQPIHYALPGDRQKFDIVQSIRTRTLLRQAHPGKRLTGEFHFRPPGDVLAAFRDHPELLDHTQEIADRCSFALGPAPPQFPEFRPLDGSKPHDFLRKLVLDGLRGRYRERADRLRPQVEEELGIIAEVGYEEYFLVVWDILQFGLVVYEEHILQICEAFAGLPPGRADVLRRALGKYKEPLIEKIRQEFVAAASSRGHADEKIVEVWDLVRGFAGYAFCKAHSTAYGVEAYQSAWLKRYHPVEFMAAVLTNGKGFYHPLVYVLECHRLGILMLPPTANQPGPQFAVEGQSIRVPLTRVKGLTQRTQERMAEEQRHGAFASLSDLYRRVVPGREEMESMLRVGAFDEFGKSRTAQFWEIQQLYRAFGGTADSGQGWLLPAPATDRVPDVPLKEPTRRQRLEWETDLLGFAASGHPLELYDDIAWDTYCPVNRLSENIGEQVVTCGLIIEQRTHHQVTGEPMKFLTLADWTGMVETELFAPTYRSYGLATVRYPVLEVTATVEPFENGRGFSLRVLRAGKPRLRRGVEAAVRSQA